MSKRRKNKKEPFIIKLANGIFTLGLAGIMLFGLQSWSASNSLKFAQISDSHFYTGQDNTSYKLRAESGKLLDDAIAQVNETPNINFVMFTGDLIDKSFEKELRGFLPHADKLKYPWYFAFGNHDTCIGGYLTPEVYISMVKAHNPNFIFDKSYYSFEPQKGYKVIVLDTIIRDRLTSNGRIDAEQLKWLEEELDDAKKDIVLIFMHVPIVEPFESVGHRLLNASEVQAVIEKHKNPIAVFQGHYHAAMIKQRENVLYVSTPSLVSYPNAFRIITVTNQRKKVVFNIDYKETRLTNIQRLAKIMVFKSNLMSGEEKDHSGTFEIARDGRGYNKRADVRGGETPFNTVEKDEK